MEIDLKLKYHYANNTLRPNIITELFPVKFDIDFTSAASELKLNDIAAVRQFFEESKESLFSSIKTYCFTEEYALPFFLMQIVHFSKEHPPSDYDLSKLNKIDTIEEYLALEYAHCGNKSFAMAWLCEQFNIQHMSTTYTDIQDWAHGFLEITINGKTEIFCPTFNMWMNVNIENIVQSPFEQRKYLCFYSEALYSTSINPDSFDENIKKYLSPKGHTVRKYHITWFSMIGHYPFVPPILTVTRNGHLAYDLRQDKRYTFKQ